MEATRVSRANHSRRTINPRRFWQIHFQYNSVACDPTQATVSRLGPCHRQQPDPTQRNNQDKAILEQLRDNYKLKFSEGEIVFDKIKFLQDQI